MLLFGPAVLRFARATGDLHSLSAADIRLIALAHTLQLARHGDAALRPLPELPSVRKGNAPAAKELPGWNESGDKWADMDKLAEEDLAEQELAGAPSYCTSFLLHASLQESSHHTSDARCLLLTHSAISCVCITVYKPVALSNN